ncbi:MAG TPA: glycosyl hydrolase 115 family protein [Steroidobacteraceae bacterium]|nr:glycosyl hydrolase 115 family protein [Steroidobacteraceae bacterium]
MKFVVALAFALTSLTTAPLAFACKQPVSVCDKSTKTSFALIHKGLPAQVLVDAAENSAVRRAAANFAADLQRVSGTLATQVADLSVAKGELVIVGVVGHDPVIDELARTRKIDVAALAGQWEAYQQIVVDHPFPSVPRALVIAGSDRRGAVFGLYDLSEKIGVSPWYWFADVPPQKHADLYITAGSRHDQPQVRYRGFFINDEAPAFSTWAQKHFGGANHEMYAHVFELLLRLKGNYLWPAMWAPRAFNDDDPQNMVLADAMGVVMGTSHHEPMTRAQAEWHRNQDQGVTGGKWDYTVNADNLRKFWRGGIERMMSKGDGLGYECLVTVGMRGDGDEPMAEGTATQLLEKIVADQRQIIADVTGKPAEQQPQVWALYKEVQDYYDHGMKVPDDVTLLFADDNWGQIRRLPTGNVERKGGYGVYYHFDYVGGPRNYKWINTNQIEKVWQQMDLAYQRGARALWIVNVGDIKPMEFPLSFFLAQAWNPEAMTPAALANYPEEWSRATFGPRQAKQIASLVTRYSQLAALRKPELIDPNSFSTGPTEAGRDDVDEFGALVKRWSQLEHEVDVVKTKLPAASDAAFFQLVEHPILALSNLYQLYDSVAMNRRLAAKGDSLANVYADQAERDFKRDAEIASKYHAINGGKWDGMMLQTHIGYTGWQQPDKDVMPEVTRVTATSSQAARTPKRPSGDKPIEIDAVHFSKAHGGAGLSWITIPNLAGGIGGITTLPQGRLATIQADGVYVEYPVKVSEADEHGLELHVSPTLDTTGGVDVRLGVSIDDGPMETLSMRLTPSPGAAKTPETRAWEQAVINNDFRFEKMFPNLAEGRHLIKVWRIDDNVILTKLVFHNYFDDNGQSYSENHVQ